MTFGASGNPGSLIQPNRLAELAGLIKASHARTLSYVEGIVERASQAGEHLIEAKRLVGHGQWMIWLHDNCALSERTAQLYMRVARNRKAITNAKSASIADLTLTAAVAEIAKPKPMPKPGSDEYERDRKEYVALYHKVVEAESELAKAEGRLSPKAAKEKGKARREWDASWGALIAARQHYFVLCAQLDVDLDRERKLVDDAFEKIAEAKR